MRSTFKVLFYVNGSKEKSGVVPIMGRVTINGSVAQQLQTDHRQRALGCQGQPGEREEQGGVRYCRDGTQRLSGTRYGI